MQFEKFLDSFGKETGSEKLVEAVREAYRACTEARHAPDPRVMAYKQAMNELRVKYPQLTETELRQILREREMSPEEVTSMLNPKSNYAVRTYTNSNPMYSFNEDDRAILAAERAAEEGA